MLIAVSGPDCSGKSGLIKTTISFLPNRDIEVVWARIGYTPGFEFFKRLFRISGQKSEVSRVSSVQREGVLKIRFVKVVWIIAAALDYIVFLTVTTRTSRDKIQIFDRWIYDNVIDLVVYHGVPRRLAQFYGKAVAKLARQPQKVFIVRLGFDEALRRSRHKKEPFADIESVRLKRHDEYDLLTDVNNMVSLDGTKKPEVLAITLVDLIR